MDMHTVELFMTKAGKIGRFAPKEVLDLVLYDNDQESDSLAYLRCLDPTCHLSTDGNLTEQVKVMMLEKLQDPTH